MKAIRHNLDHTNDRNLYCNLPVPILNKHLKKKFTSIQTYLNKHHSTNTHFQKYKAVPQTSYGFVAQDRWSSSLDEDQGNLGAAGAAPGRQKKTLLVRRSFLSLRPQRQKEAVRESLRQQRWGASHSSFIVVMLCTLHTLYLGPSTLRWRPALSISFYIVSSWTIASDPFVDTFSVLLCGPGRPSPWDSWFSQVSSEQVPELRRATNVAKRNIGSTALIRFSLRANYGRARAWSARQWQPSQKKEKSNYHKEPRPTNQQEKLQYQLRVAQDTFKRVVDKNMGVVQNPGA